MAGVGARAFALTTVMLLSLSAATVASAGDRADAGESPPPADDGWPDASRFLEEPYGRLSLVAFGGGGGAWNDLEQLDSSRGVVAGGGGFRYELARRYGIHAGVDAAVSRDATAFFFEVGSGWMRP